MLHSVASDLGLLCLLVTLLGVSRLQWVKINLFLTTKLKKTTKNTKKLSILFYPLSFNQEECCILLLKSNCSLNVSDNIYFLHAFPAL